MENYNEVTGFETVEITKAPIEDLEIWLDRDSWNEGEESAIPFYI